MPDVDSIAQPLAKTRSGSKATTHGAWIEVDGTAGW